MSWVQRGLPPGHWETVDGILQFTPAAPPKPQKKRGRKPLPEIFIWDDATLRMAHDFYTYGNKSVWAREGHRVYSRLNKQRARAYQARRAA